MDWPNSTAFNNATNLCPQNPNITDWLPSKKQNYRRLPIHSNNNITRYNAKNPQVALSIQQSIDDIVIHITMKVAVAYSNNRRILYNTRCKNKYVFDWPQNDKCLSVASQRCLLKWKREIQNASNSILTKTTSQNQFCNNDAVEEKLDPILK
jgi:hypothetical protein